jgi:hypothetical protein
VPPAGMYGLYLIVKMPLPTYVSVANPLNLPDEYIDALIWSMAVRMQMAYGLPARPDHVTQAALAMNTLRQANAQIPGLLMPIRSVTGGGGVAAHSSPGFTTGGW